MEGKWTNTSFVATETRLLYDMIGMIKKNSSFELILEFKSSTNWELNVCNYEGLSLKMSFSNDDLCLTYCYKLAWFQSWIGGQILNRGRWDKICSACGHCVLVSNWGGRNHLVWQNAACPEEIAILNFIVIISETILNIRKNSIFVALMTSFRYKCSFPWSFYYFVTRLSGYSHLSGCTR